MFTLLPKVSSLCNANAVSNIYLWSRDTTCAHAYEHTHVVFHSRLQSWERCALHVWDIQLTESGHQTCSLREPTPECKQQISSPQRERESTLTLKSLHAFLFSHKFSCLCTSAKVVHMRKAGWKPPITFPG